MSLDIRRVGEVIEEEDQNSSEKMMTKIMKADNGLNLILESLDFFRLKMKFIKDFKDDLNKELRFPARDTPIEIGLKDELEVVPNFL